MKISRPCVTYFSPKVEPFTIISMSQVSRLKFILQFPLVVEYVESECE